MLFFCTLFSQSDTVYIHGVVRDETSSLPVKNAVIHLKLSNGRIHKATSNDSGYYSFKLCTVFATGELSIASDKNTQIVNRKTNGFIASKDKLTFDFPKDRHITYDFRLKHGPMCFLSLPEFRFKENSTEMVDYKDFYGKDSAMLPEQQIQYYTELLSANPGIVVELKGKCDQAEKNREELSEKRARLIADKLIAKGIPLTRLVVIGAGFQPMPHVTEADIAPKTEDQKKLAHQKNRSVSFRIIHWDYEDTNSPIRIPDQRKNDEDSDIIED